ncbi:hypothetical protein AL527_14420 [Pseudomonas fulva]|uniref:hypothetical protein n=1 Tax=Pseudomonas fulva TaxID=47880 RepID=UPI000CE985C3|nr:hypothetical protein [Pseudomonas fulva]AVF56260.1 hypothetical protein AL527_14420 [Pseudomonas fulva]
MSIQDIATQTTEVAEVKRRLAMSHELQSAFQERLNREIDKNTELEKEVTFLFTRNLVLEGQVQDANAFITEMAALIGLQVEVA